MPGQLPTKLLDTASSALLVALVWTLLLGTPLYLSIAREREHAMAMATAEGQTILNKDFSFRNWVNSHGGVYVPVTDTQKSVPWLAHVPGRDVTTTDGRKLTLLNPASALRQVMDAYSREYGIRGRITGLRYLSPDNAPDPWEKAQMEAFERGERKDVSAVVDIDGAPYLRYLQAMYMTPGCEKCHAILGFKEGDLRGAIGVNVPMAPYYQHSAEDRTQLAWTYGFVWVLGLIGIAWIRRESSRNERARMSREAELSTSAQRIRNMSDAAGAYLWEIDTDMVYTYVSGQSAQVKGRPPEELLGHTPMEFMPDEDIAGVGEIVKRAIADKTTFRLQHRDITPTGETWWEEVYGAVFCDEAGKVIGLRGTGMSINARKQAEQELRASEQRFRDIAGVSADWIWEVDAQGRYTYASDGVTAMLGYAPNEIIGKTPFDLMARDEAQRVAAAFGKFIAAKMPFSDMENIVLGKDGAAHITLTNGTPILDAQGNLLGYRGIDRDFTARKQAEEQIRQLAFYDPVTGLPNRRLLDDRMNQAMAASRRSGCHAALLFLDLDNFKPLNDIHGHAVGDLLLIEAADRLKSCVREMDTVARFGGDEFVVMISELAEDRAESVAEAGRIAEKVRSAMSEPYLLTVRPEGKGDFLVEHHCTASIGVALFIDHHATQDDILKWADEAMYQAKSAGRNLVRFHEGQSGVTAIACRE